MYVWLCLIGKYIYVNITEKEKETMRERETEKGTICILYVSRYGATRMEISEQEYEWNGQSISTLLPVSWLLLFLYFPCLLDYVAPQACPFSQRVSPWSRRHACTVNNEKIPLLTLYTCISRRATRATLLFLLFARHRRVRAYSPALGLRQARPERINSRLPYVRALRSAHWPSTTPRSRAYLVP